MIKIELHNRLAGDDLVGRYEAPDGCVPRVGDVVNGSESVYTKDGPFAKVHWWRVETVVWEVASPGSRYVLDRIREMRTVPDGGLLASVALFVVPVDSPYRWEPADWMRRLRWANAAECEQTLARAIGEPENIRTTHLGEDHTCFGDHPYLGDDLGAVHRCGECGSQWTVVSDDMGVLATAWHGGHVWWVSSAEPDLT